MHDNSIIIHNLIFVNRLSKKHTAKSPVQLHEAFSHTNYSASVAVCSAADAEVSVVVTAVVVVVVVVVV